MNVTSSEPETGQNPARWLPYGRRWSEAPRLVWHAIRGTPVVASYPKSGRTWLRIMLDELGIRAEYTHFGAGVGQPRRVEELTPNPLWCAGRPTLLLLRHPLDTLVSSYFQATRRRATFSGSLAEFAQHPSLGIEKLLRWNLLWAERGVELPRFGIVEYEAMHADPRVVLQQAAAIFHAARRDAEIARAVAAGSIETMRANEQAGTYRARYRRALVPRDQSDPESFKVRRGVVGGFRDYLAAEDVARCEEALARHDYWRRIRAAIARAGAVAGPVA